MHVVVAFDGRRGDPNERFDAEEYVARRREEARAAAAHLGLGEYEFWDHPEGHEPTASQLLDGARAVAASIERFRPDLVYAPWIGEQHVDHHTLARAVRLAVALTGTRAAPAGSGVNGSFSAANLAAAVTSKFDTASVTADRTLTLRASRQDTLSASETAAVGVDLDYELQNLNLIQTAYSANARVMEVVDALMRRLMEI